MPGLNKVLLIGNLGRDPETKFSPKGTQISTFSMAVNRRWRNNDGELQERTDWFNLEAWGGLAEICQKYLHKGSQVYVEGRLQTDRYEHEGETRYFTKVVVSSLIMLDRKEGEEVPETEE